jgi:hypothetical protein
MKKSLLLILCIAALLSTNATPLLDHKFYVSNTFIEYNAQESLLQIRVQFFIDDFERIMKKESGNRKFELQDRTTGNEHIDNSAVMKYLESNLKLKIDNTMKSLYFLGYQKDNAETVTLYLEVPASNLNQIEIQNTFFLSEFHDQKNGVEMKWYGSIQQEYLNQDRTTCVFTRP